MTLRRWFRLGDAADHSARVPMATYTMFRNQKLTLHRSRAKVRPKQGNNPRPWHE